MLQQPRCRVVAVAQSVALLHATYLAYPRESILLHIQVSNVNTLTSHSALPPAASRQTCLAKLAARRVWRYSTDWAPAASCRLCWQGRVDANPIVNEFSESPLVLLKPRSDSDSDHP